MCKGVLKGGGFGMGILREEFVETSFMRGFKKGSFLLEKLLSEFCLGTFINYVAQRGEGVLKFVTMLLHGGRGLVQALRNI